MKKMNTNKKLYETVLQILNREFNYGKTVSLTGDCKTKIVANDDGNLRIPCGQSVASAFLEALEVDVNYVYNDLDMFICDQTVNNITLAALGQTRSQFFRKASDTTTWFDAYGHIKFSNLNRYQVMYTFKEECYFHKEGKGVNVIYNYSHIKTSGNKLDEVIQSFDINSTQVYLDVENKAIVYTDAFKEFIKTRLLEIITFATPYHSIIRYIRKLNEFGCKGNTKEALEKAQILIAFDKMENYDSNTMNRTFYRSILGKEQADAFNKYAIELEPYFTLSEITYNGNRCFTLINKENPLCDLASVDFFRYLLDRDFRFDSSKAENSIEGYIQKTKNQGYFDYSKAKFAYGDIISYLLLNGYDFYTTVGEKTKENFNKMLSNIHSRRTIYASLNGTKEHDMLRWREQDLVETILSFDKKTIAFNEEEMELMYQTILTVRSAVERRSLSGYRNRLNFFSFFEALKDLNKIGNTYGSWSLSYLDYLMENRQYEKYDGSIETLIKRIKRVDAGFNISFFDDLLLENAVETDFKGFSMKIEEVNHKEDYLEKIISMSSISSYTEERYRYFSIIVNDNINIYLFLNKLNDSVNCYQLEFICSKSGAINVEFGNELLDVLEKQINAKISLPKQKPCLDINPEITINIDDEEIPF